MLLKLYTSLILFLTSNAQFSNFFAQMMNGNGQAGTSSGSGGSQNTGSGKSNCITASVSCLPAPWCKRTVDKSGCPKCECGGMSPMMAGGSAKNFPTSGGNPSTSNLFTSMLGGGAGRGFPNLTGFGYGKGPINPMAMVFGSGSMLGGGSGSPFLGGMGSFPNPMGGSGSGMSSQTQTTTEKSNCDPAPYTCPVPPPWCQRLVDLEGCVKCYCGQQLQEYLQNLQGIITTKSPKNQTTSGSSDATQLSHTTEMTSPKTTTTTTTPPLGMSCLANFMCTLTCDNGYKTADDGCPMCECIGDVPQMAQSTLPPSNINLPTDGSVITCPGIFDCQKMCLNGFQTDSQGCPLCQCEAD